MTVKATLVVNGFLKLTEEEKGEVVAEINKYYKGNQTERRSLENFSIERTAGVILGPTRGSCPCCGR